MRMNTHTHTHTDAHALTYTEYSREDNGMRSESGMPQVTARDCQRTHPVTHTLHKLAAHTHKLTLIVMKGHNLIGNLM